MAGVDGIVSGIKTSQIIQGLLDAARGPIRAMQGKISQLEARRAKFQELNTLLQSLQTAVGAVNDASELASLTATSSQPTALSVTVDGSAAPGPHTVQVTALAQSTLQRSGGFASPSTQLKAGTMTITVAGTPTTVPLSDAEGTGSIEGIADYVNENVSGVHAYVLNTGSGGTPYRLMIEGNETGSANAVTISVSQSGGGATLSFSQLRAAQNASLTVDSTAVSTASNSPSDILPGVTLQLSATTSGTATINIQRDTAAMAGKVQSVVDAYNNLVDFVKAQTGDKEGAVLSGDATMRSVFRRLQTVLAGGYSSGPISGLNELGLGTAQDGTLEFDSAAFSTAANASFADTMNALTGSGGLFGELSSELDLVTDPVTGLMQPRLDSFDTQVEDLQERIAEQESRLDSYEARLRAQFTHLEVVLGKYQSTGDFLAAQLASLTQGR